MRKRRDKIRLFYWLLGPCILPAFLGENISLAASARAAGDVASPYDYSYSGLEQAGHTSASTLASALGVPLDQVNLGTVSSNSISGISVNITNADPPDALISMNWGDGSAYQVQARAFSHVYSPGTYIADLLYVNGGAVHKYVMTIQVTTSSIAPVSITVATFPPVEKTNPGLIPAKPVPGVPNITP